MPDISASHRVVRRAWKQLGCFVLISCCLACVNRKRSPYSEQHSEQEENEEQTSTNPVFSSVLADPTIVEYEGYFYGYGTDQSQEKPVLNR